MHGCFDVKLYCHTRKTAAVLIVLMQKDSGPFHILFAECLDKEIANEVRLEKRIRIDSFTFSLTNKLLISVLSHQVQNIEKC